MKTKASRVGNNSPSLHPLSHPPHQTGPVTPGLAFVIKAGASEAHATDGIAPATLAGAAAESADLEHIGAAGRQVLDHHAAGAFEIHRADVGAGQTVRADEGVTNVVAAGVFHGFHAQDELAGVAVDDVLDAGRLQRNGGAVGAGCLEAAGEQRGEVVAMVFLHVGGELTQETDEGLAHVVLLRRVCGAARFSGGESGGEVRDTCEQGRLGHRRCGEGRFAIKATVYGHGSFFEVMVGLVGKV